VQCTSPVWLDFYRMSVPCGHCVNCRIAHSREWAVRLVHEMGYHKDSVFVTLTYDDEHLPADGSISKDELQRFFKRLRKSTPWLRFKYFACGEYGGRFGRPHYHTIILGLGPRDSPLIEKAWSLGRIFCGSVTYDSCRYVADYIQKKYNGVKAESVYGEKEVPFQLSSLGMGKQFALDNREYLSTKLGCTMRGDEVGLPRYYKRVLGLGPDELGPEALERLEDLNGRLLSKAVDPELVPGRLARSRRQANANAIARLALRDEQRKVDK